MSLFRGMCDLWCYGKSLAEMNRKAASCRCCIRHWKNEGESGRFNVGYLLRRVLAFLLPAAVAAAIRALYGVVHIFSPSNWPPSLFSQLSGDLYFSSPRKSLQYCLTRRLLVSYMSYMLLSNDKSVRRQSTHWYDNRSSSLISESVRKTNRISLGQKFRECGYQNLCLRPAPSAQYDLDGGRQERTFDPMISFSPVHHWNSTICVNECTNIQCAGPQTKDKV